MTDPVRQQLQYLMVQYGRSICDDPKRCEAMLRDLCPQHRREVNLLVAALREGAAKAIINAPPLAPIESTLARAANTLHDNLGTAEHLAQWAVESWALALGVAFKPAAQPSAQQSKQPLVAPAAPQASAVNHAAAFAQLKQELKQDTAQECAKQAIVEQFKGWQKIGNRGEKLAADAPQWAAVIDEKTKLMWAINPSKTADFPNPAQKMTWDKAKAWVQYVNKQGWCGYYDWRLPTIDELKTLLTPSQQQGLHLRRDVFNDVNVEFYWVWSSSPVVDNSYDAWVVYFYNGYGSYSDKSNSHYVRLVRAK